MTSLVIFSLHFNGHFPGVPGLARTRMFPFWMLLELTTTEVVVITGAISRAKLQSNRHHQQINTQDFLQAGCPSCHPTITHYKLVRPCSPVVSSTVIQLVVFFNFFFICLFFSILCVSSLSMYVFFCILFIICIT